MHGSGRDPDAAMKEFGVERASAGFGNSDGDYPVPGQPVAQNSQRVARVIVLDRHALSVGWPYKQGDDEAAFLKKAEKVRDELRQRIPSVEKLVELDP